MPRRLLRNIQAKRNADALDLSCRVLLNPQQRFYKLGLASPVTGDTMWPYHYGTRHWCRHGCSKCLASVSSQLPYGPGADTDEIALQL